MFLSQLSCGLTGKSFCELVGLEDLGQELRDSPKGSI